MNKKPYSNLDVENLLKELAEFDKCRMNDTMTAHLLDIIDHEVKTCSRHLLYKRLLQSAAAVLVLLLGVAFFVKQDVPQPSFHTENGPCGITKQQVPLTHLDNTMQAGFSPVPQELYTRRNKRRYGVSVSGHYNYTACTDTL